MDSDSTIVIKPFATLNPRDPYATSRYMQDLRDEGHKVPHDEFGPMSGSINCLSADRAGCLKEISTLLRLYGNPRSTQAAEHNVISYPVGLRPSRAQIERDIRIDLKKRGMDDHKVVWDAHDNTDNFHAHYLLCRVSPTPNKKGRYRLADDGLVKVTRKDDRGRVRTRTDESGCRQSAISEINALYGYSFDGLTHDSDGNPQPRTKAKDSHSDKTRAGERKSGKKSRERQLAEIIKEVFDSAIAEASISKTSLWKIVDREFSSRALEMVIKIENGRPVGGYVIGPDNRKCSFGKAGKEYTTPTLVKRFGPPSATDSARHTEYEFEPFEYREHDLTVEEAKKRLLPVFRAAVDSETWTSLIEGVQQQGMTLARLGGGLVVQFNDGRDTIKCSDISNKYSLSRLEKILGACPLPKSAPAVPSDRDLLIRDAHAVISRNASRRQGLYHVKPDLEANGIRIERKIFTKNDGERVRYYVLVRGATSVPFSALGRDANGSPYTMSRLKRLDAINPTAQQAAWFARAQKQIDESRAREAAYQAEAPAMKERKSNNLTMMAMFAHMVALFKKETKNVVQADGNPVDREGQTDGQISPSQSLFAV